MLQSKPTTFAELYPKVLMEINSVLTSVNEVEINGLVKRIVVADKIVVHGAGRVGMAIRGFAMRLGHLGFRAHSLEI